MPTRWSNRCRRPYALAAPNDRRVTRVERHLAAVTELLARYRLEPVPVAHGDTIPGSYWGESEAGLVGNRIYFRPRHAAAFGVARGLSFHLHGRRAPRAAGTRCGRRLRRGERRLLSADRTGERVRGVGLAADVQRHGCVGLHVPPRLGARMVRAGRRGCAQLAAASAASPDRVDDATRPAKAATGTCR